MILMMGTESAELAFDLSMVSNGKPRMAQNESRVPLLGLPTEATNTAGSRSVSKHERSI